MFQLDAWPYKEGHLFPRHWPFEKSMLKAGPLWGYFSHFWWKNLNFFFVLKALGKKWKMIPLLCACAVVITFETKNVEKLRAPRSIEFNFYIDCDRHKRFSQNERWRADVQKLASAFLIFACRLSYDISKFSDDFTPFFRLWKTITMSPGKNLKNLSQILVAMNMMNKFAKFQKDSPSDKKVKFTLPSAIKPSETAVLCTTLYINLMQEGNFGGTVDQLFLWIVL